MAEDERYVTMWHGLFPRFVFEGFVFAFVGVMLRWIASSLIPVPVLPTTIPLLRSEVQGVVSIVFFPFAFFAMFYLSSRIRVDLGKDYAAVAASIFLGTLSLILLFGAPEALATGSLASGAFPGSSVVDSLAQSTGSAVSESIDYTFVGFAALLLSYRRRI